MKHRTRSTGLILAGALLLGLAPASARAQQKASPPSSADAEPGYVPSGPEKCVEVGDYYFRRKNYRGALSRYQEAVQTDPYYAPAYLGLGKVYDKIGLKQKALSNYQKYLDMLPSDKQAEEAKDVHKAIARLERQLGKPATGKD